MKLGIRRTSFRIILLVTVSILFSSGLFTVASSAMTKPVSTAPDSCVDNGYLTAQVDDTTGQYTFDIGTCSTAGNSANYILFPVGTSFLTVTDFTSGVNYTEGGDGYFSGTTDLGTPTSSGGFGTGSAGANIVTVFPATPEGLVVTQTITILGSTAATSVITMNVQVANTGNTPQKVGIRYLWDTQVGGYDGTWLQEYSGTTPTCLAGGSECVSGITGYETDFFPPPGAFTSYAMSGCTTNANPTPPPYTCDSSTFGPGSGTFEVYGSISSGPGATTPARFIFGYWADMVDSSYAYAPTPSNEIGSYVPNVDSTQDSAMLYYFANQTLPAGTGTESVQADITNAPSQVITSSATTTTTTTTATSTQTTTALSSTTVSGSTTATTTATVPTTVTSSTCYDPTVTVTQTQTVTVPTTVTSTTTYTTLVTTTTTQTVYSTTTECLTTITTATGVPQFGATGSLWLILVVAFMAPLLFLLRKSALRNPTIARIFRR